MFKKKIFSLFAIITVITIILLKVLSLLPNNGYNIVTTTPKNSIPLQDNTCLGLNYHRVRKPTMWNKFIENITNSQELSTYSVYSDEFENQIIKLKESGAYFATLDEITQFKINGQFPNNCVWISFDDVDKSVYEVAFPILKKYNIPFTLFVIAGQVGSNNFSNLELATWDQLREMKDSGFASFGSHTYDMHYYEDETDSAQFLSPENYSDFSDDIRLSKKVIDEELDLDIKALAFPFGNANDDIMKIVEDSGFTSAYLLNNETIYTDSNPLAQGRYLIDKITFNNIIINKNK